VIASCVFLCVLWIYYFVWKLSFAISRRLFCRINLAHSSERPRAQQNSGRKLWKKVCSCSHITQYSWNNDFHLRSVICVRTLFVHGTNLVNFAWLGLSVASATAAFLLNVCEFALAVWINFVKNLRLICLIKFLFNSSYISVPEILCFCEPKVYYYVHKILLLHPAIMQFHSNPQLRISRWFVVLWLFHLRPCF
jgi:hypothetical protein